MVIPKFRNPLPEDRLSERERDERIRILNQFSKKLSKESRTDALDDTVAIRQQLLYVGMRLDLLDLENRNARLLKRFIFLLGHTAKPVPQGLIGVTAGAAIDLGLEDTESMIRSHEVRTEGLIAEISLIAPEINRLLDQRQADDRGNFVLRPSSCLPEAVSIDQDAPSKSEDTPELPKSDGSQADTARVANRTGEQDAVEAGLVDIAPAEIGRDKNRFYSPKGKAPKPSPISRPGDEELSREWLEQRKSVIRVNGKPYGRDHLADKLMQVEYLTARQRDAVVLWYGYDMRDIAISTLLHIKPKTVYGHRKGAESKLEEDSTMMLLLKNFKRRNKRSKEEEDPSRPG